MGGLRDALPRTYWAMLIGGLALAGIFPLSGFFSKDPILAARLAGGTYGRVLFVVGLVGAFLTGALHVPDALPRLRRRALGVRARAPPRHGHGEAPFSMGWAGRGARRPLGHRRLGSRSPASGTPFADWLEPVGAAARRADGHAGLGDLARLGVACALGGIGSPGSSTSRRSVARARARRERRRVLEHKFYFDELYDRALLPSPPSRSHARSAAASSSRSDRLDRRGGHRPFARQAAPRRSSRPASSAATRSRSRRARRPRRRLRGASMSGWLTTTLIFLPLAGALVLWLVPWPRLWAGSLATLVALVEVGLWIVALIELRLRRRAPGRAAARRGSATSASRTTSACSASRSGSSG